MVILVLVVLLVVSRALNNSLSHDYLVSDEQMRRGEISSAGAFRFQGLYQKLQNDSDISIAVIGGPVELGDHCSDCTVLWHEYIRKWLEKTFPKMARAPEVHIIDIQNTTTLRSTLEAGGKTQAAASRNYDLIIVAGVGSYYPPTPGNEMPTKGIDVNRHYAEQILRDLLRAPTSPAVLIVAWLNDYWWDTEDAEEMLKHSGLAYRFGTLQDEAYEFLAMYYEISMMSARNALIHSTFVSTASNNLAQGWNYTDILQDRLYPTHAGHNLFGQLAVNFLCKQLHIAQGLGPPNPSKRQRTLSPPIFENPERLAALRRSMDFSGFPGYPVDDVLPADVSREHSDGVGVESFSLEMRSALVALALLETVCFASQAPSSSTLSFLYSDVAPTQRRQLHMSSLEALHFLAAAQLVVFYEAVHRTDTYFRQFAACGQYWIQFFFALSGFASYFAQDNVAELPDPPGFLRRQLAAWYPVYLVGAILILLAEARPKHSAAKYASDNWIPGFLMADCWAYPYGSDSPNGPAWFLSTLLVFWLCFPHWYSAIRAVRTPWMAVMLAYLSTFFVPLAYLSRHLGVFGNAADLFPHPSGFLKYHPFTHWQPFIFGMGLARVASETRFEALPAIARSRAASAALAVLFVLPVLVPWTPSPALEILLQQGTILLPVFGIVLVFVAAGEDKLLTPRLLQSSPALWLGQMSRPLLVLHAPFRIWISAYLIDPSVQSILIIQIWATWAYTLLEERLVSVISSRAKDKLEQAAKRI